MSRLLYFAIIALQVFAGVHAFRRGNYLWLAFIVFFPPIGPLIYLFAAMLPAMRGQRGLRRTVEGAGSAAINTLQPGRRLAQLEERLEEQDTLATRQAYAEELMRFERTDEAIEVLEQGLKGVFANDAQGLFTLAQAYMTKADYGYAQGLLETIQEDNPGFEPDKVKILRARALEAQGKLDEATAEYREVATRNVSEEPRFYLVRALKKRGDETEARSVVEQAEKFYKRSSNIYRRENAPWMKQMRSLFEDS